jgi:diguanylate cyclase (GGDEF)-like protein
MGARPDASARFFAQARALFDARSVDEIAAALLAGALRLCGARSGAVAIGERVAAERGRRRSGGARTRLALRDGRRTLGALVLDAPRPRDAASRRALELLARAGALALANALRAESDPLTGLPNRAGTLRVLETELGRARRHRRALALAMFDLDRFKALNDRDGHAAGDVALRRVAALLRERSRASDTAGRWGGDELVLVLPETTLEGAITVAEKIRAAAEAAGGPTLSAGVASFPGDGESARALVDVADACLYRAKAAGRNRVEPEVDSRARRSA